MHLCKWMKISFSLSFNLYPDAVLKIQYIYVYRKQIAETFGNRHLRFPCNKLFISCKEEDLLPPSGFYTAQLPGQSWPYFLSFLPWDVVPYHCLLSDWFDTNLCPIFQCECPYVWTFPLRALCRLSGSTVGLQPVPAPYPARQEGFIHSYRYLVVQTPAAVCSMTVWQGLFGVLKSCPEATLVKLEGELPQSSEMKAPLPSADAFWLPFRISAPPVPFQGVI